MRSAQTEWHNTRELQRATVEHTALTHQFQYCFNAQSISTHAKHKSTAATKKRKSDLETSVPLRSHIELDSAAKATTPKTAARASQLFSATEPPFNRKNTRFRANPILQIAPMM